MSQSVLVIGGTRYFGIRLVEGLLAAGQQVTIANRGLRPDGFGERVRRLRVDRRDALAMQACFAGGSGYDLVYDQLCYSAQDAAIAAQLFAGRVGRYLMSSTIEVYGGLHGRWSRPYREDDLPLDLGDGKAQAYGEAKRQAEALLLATEQLPAACLRLGHVLGGPEDFTGRLQAHVRAVQRGEPLRHAAAAGGSSFIDVAGVVACLLWAGEQEFRGPLNIASEGQLSAPQLRQRMARCLGLEAPCLPQPELGDAPFDYGAVHAMDLARARSLGWRFAHHEDWLDDLILQHAEASQHGLG